MNIFDFHHFAAVGAAHAVNTLLEGMVLTALSWCALRWFGRRSAMTRFAVWFATLLVIAALPFVSLGGASIPAYDPSPELTLSGSWGIALFIAWAAIASVLLTRVAVSLLKIAKLRRECSEINNDPRKPQIEGLTKGRAKVLLSDEVQVPTALGFFKPAVILPAWTLEQLSDDELKAIVLHELAHLRRWDDWTNLAQKIIKAVFFFHPAVWWIDSRLTLEREMACDDLVLEQTNDARIYAASLVSVAEKVVAEKMRLGRALALAQNALGRVRQVSLRLTTILDAQHTAGTRGWGSATAMIGTLALVAVVAMPYAPEVISFDAKPQALGMAAKADATPVRVIPASLRWSAESAGTKVHSAMSVNGRRHEGKDALAIPAKARIRRADRRAKVVMAKAPSTPVRQKFLVLDTSETDSYGAVWTLSVWHYTSPDGTHVVQETIVMSSI